MKSSIPKPLSTGINANKRKTPSSPAGPPPKRVVSNPLAQSTAGSGARKPSGFVPTSRKASAVPAPAPSRPTSSLAVSTRRTASSAAGPSTLGASRLGPGAAGRAVPAPTRRPPPSATTRPAPGRAGPSRGVSPGMGASSGVASRVS
jgi:hypothetical protein